MIFEKITIQNFLSIRSITLDLQDRGLVLLKGKNEDNPDLNNNGSGKSSIIEAIVYALYGRTIRGVKGDAIVHRIPKKNTKIFLDLIDDNGDKYRIARYRKHSTNKNRSMLYRNGKDITPKSEADFNDYVANLLQADYLTFTSSLLYSAESFKFTSATDAEMKNTFDVMLGLDVFQRCLEITKNRIKSVDSELSSIEWKISDRKTKIGDLDTKIEEAEQEKVDYESTKQEKIDNLKKSIVELNESLQSQQEELEELQESLSKVEKSKEAAEKALEKKKKSLKEIDALKQETQSVKDEIAEHKRAIKSHESDIEDCKKKVIRLEKSIQITQEKMDSLESQKSDLHKKIGQPCPVCGQPMTKDSVEPAKIEISEKIQELQSEIDSFTEEISTIKNADITSLGHEIDDHNAEIEELQETLDEFEELIEKSSGLVKEKEKLEEKAEKAQKLYYSTKSSVTVAENDIEHTQEKIDSLGKQIEDIQSEENPYEVIISKYKKEQETAKTEIEELQQSIQDQIDEKECLEFWQQAYSNQGIKSLILDDITPFLNRRVNKYLGKLTSGHIEVKFNTQTTLKSGETREKFSIEINNTDGGQEYIANSGGERKRIDLCINLALQDLVASRSSKRINISIFDETFDALDEQGVEKVIELLQELSSEKSTILVVSHNQHLQSYFSNVVTIVKKDGYSTLLEDDLTEENEEVSD